MSVKSIATTFFDYVRSTQPSWLGIATIVMIVATPATGYGVSHSHHGWVPTLLAVQALLAVSLWGIPTYKVAKGTNDGVRVIAEERTRINDVLDLLLEELATLANSSSATFAKQQARVQSAVLQAAVTLIGPDRVRCCFFRYARVELTSKSSAPWVTLLRHDQSVGRAGSSGATFNDRNQAGAAVIKLVRSGASNFVENVDVDPPIGWDPKVRGKYKTFISVAVRAKSVPLGMLSVDSLKPGDLKEQDVDLLRVFAWILATALTMGARLAPPEPKTSAAGPKPSS